VTTLREAFERYLAEKVGPLSLRARREYRDILLEFMDLTDNIELRDLRLDDLKRYRAYLHDPPGKRDKFSEQAVRKHFLVIDTFVNWLAREGLVSLRRSNGAKVPKPAVNHYYVLTDGELKKLKKVLEAKKNSRDKTIVELFLATGMSLEELTSLNLDDLNLAEGTVRVRANTSQQALVPLDAATLEYLGLYVTRDRIAPPQENALFVGRFGKRLGKQAVERLVEKILAKVGRDGLYGPGIFQHTFVIQFMKSGGRIEELGRILGLKNLRSAEERVQFSMF
jgi:integrase/recombinase XerC